MTAPTELASLLDAVSNNPCDWTAVLVAADWCGDNGYGSLEWLLRYRESECRLRVKGPNVAFTGSRRYGTPRPDSDWDWVWLDVAVPRADTGKVMCDRADDYVGPGEPGRYGADWFLRFGPVNVLYVTTINQWRAWVDGTDSLVARRPVTRNDAVAEFRKQFRDRKLKEMKEYHDNNG